VRDLPASWGTLAELARVKPEQIEAAIETGLVRPDMTRQDTRELVYRPSQEEIGRARAEEEQRQAGICEDAADLIGRLESLSAAIDAAVKSGHYGTLRPRKGKGSKRNTINTTDHLMCLFYILNDASSGIGDCYDAMANGVGLPQRDEA
jgi:hypothetical protein